MTEPWRLLRRCAAMGVALALLCGCATSTVVLLPEKDGRQTSISVKQGGTEVILEQPYAAAKANALGPRTYVATPQEVQAKFASALAAQPARATTFTLYFIEGKDEFTDESRQDVDRILSEIARRPVPDVLVVGHTDAVGNDQTNDALGLQRAETVRAALMKLGIPADDIRAISRGKRALAIPTADGVAEPRNRRVVILVR